MPAGDVLEENRGSTTREAINCPNGMEKGTRRERLGKENDQCVAPRSLKVFGYLGMLSATPTDIGLPAFKRPDERERKTAMRHNPVCWYAQGLPLKEKSGPCPSWQNDPLMAGFQLTQTFATARARFQRTFFGRCLNGPRALLAPVCGAAGQAAFDEVLLHSIEGGPQSNGLSSKRRGRKRT